MSRQLDTFTLDTAAKHYAGLFMRDSGAMDADWVIAEFYKFAYKDEFDYLVKAMHQHLGPAAIVDLDKRAKKDFEPRQDKVLEELLAKKLAVDLDGKHIEGQIGVVKVGSRLIGTHVVDVEAPWSVQRRRALGLPKTPEHREVIQQSVKLVWPIYAGEEDERARSQGGIADAIPGTVGRMINELWDDERGALNTRIANVNALAGANAIVDLIDGGSAGAVIQGRTGGQPTDPDTAVTGTELFNMTASVTAFNAATDAGPGAKKVANTVTDDSSADFTATLGYIRVSSSNAPDTPLVDQIDGEAGTSGADWNFNTLAIVTAATVSTTSWDITLPEG